MTFRERRADSWAVRVTPPKQARPRELEPMTWGWRLFVRRRARQRAHLNRLQARRRQR